ncbi:MAG: tripartite tricarboxylate transporter substrate binding protein [Betaproteobacteria bacterium]|nr:tripartite tricarboxylate transporter substrate binding protein [Betaproteobacteria bacterium]
MNRPHHHVRHLVIGLTMALTSALSLAQTPFPQKPVKILVGFTPGGVPDIAARLLAQKWSEQWKQAVTVENRLGAGSNVAAQALSQSPPDGHSLLSISSAHAIAPAIYSKLSFDPQKDFSGISLTATGPALVVVSAQLGVNTLAEFLALARARPGQLNYASAGTGSGSQFAAELLKAQAGIQMVHVPFKGIPEALTDTIAGRTHLFISPYASAIQLVKDGKAKAIAVTSTQRMAETPDLPTVAEAGLPGYKWIFWYGLLAPAKTPRAIVDKINADLVSVLRLPEVRQRFGPLGIEPATNTPDEMDKLIADEVINFKKLAAAAQIQID